MKIIQSEIENVNLNLPLKSSLVVIGYFDGMHSLHQKLISTAQKLADQESLKFILITFNQKVGDYLHHTNNDLISSKVKNELLKANFEIDYLIELKVNQTLVNMSKQKFLDFLEKNLGTKMMVEGQDFSFGAQRTGKVEDLIKRFGADQVVILKRKKSVSSTKIRQLLGKGKLLKVNFYLMRRLELEISVAESKSSHPLYELVYPQTKLQAGTYFAVDQNHQEISFKINEKQKIISLEDSKNLLHEDGTYQLKFKKFIRAKK